MLISSATIGCILAVFSEYCNVALLYEHSVYPIQFEQTRQELENITLLSWQHKKGFAVPLVKSKVHDLNFKNCEKF